MTEVERSTDEATDSAERKERRDIYDKYWAEAQTRMRLSSDNFDKSILTYSTGGLAVSLTFLKDFVPIKSAVWPTLLFSSWTCFLLATSLTIVSFLVSHRAQELSMEFAEEYLLNGKEEFRDKTTWHGAFIKHSNIVAGAVFVLALLSTSLFVAINLSGRPEMTNSRVISQDGMPPAMMQKVPSNAPSQRGMPSATIPKAPSSPNTTTQSPASQPGAASSPGSPKR
jgi:hypothetical protein